MKKLYSKLNTTVNKLDRAPLGLLYFLVVGIIMTPILIVGKQAVFTVHDQLDEVFLNTLFTAKYWGQNTVEQMMCGVPMAGLKPSAYLFLPLYRIFEPLTAFVIQFFLVISTAFWGVYLTVKKTTGSSIAALVSASLFALIPFRSIYGTCITGFPLFVYCFMLLSEFETCGDKRRNLLWPLLGIVYLTLSSNLILNGFGTLFMGLMGMLYIWKKNRKFPGGMFAGLVTSGVLYLLVNADLILELFSKSDFVSHRVEFQKEYTGESFWYFFRGMLRDGFTPNESFHTYIWIAAALAAVLLLVSKNRKNLLIPYLATLLCILFSAAVFALCSTDGFKHTMDRMGGFMGSFQFDRFYYLLPGAMYILLGISVAVIIDGLGEGHRILGVLLAVAVVCPTLLLVARNSTFYMNVNQIRKHGLTGNVSWEILYSEDVMEQIETDIGKDMSSYRVASLGICPVVPLMHGFYTIDGYSNNYSLDYKHLFREIQTEELALNDSMAAYFDGWGSRCYLFSHEWGNATYLNKELHVQLTDFRFDTEKMKELNCRYIFCAGEILEAEQKGLRLLGAYTSDKSMWAVWVYEIE